MSREEFKIVRKTPIYEYEMYFGILTTDAKQKGKITISLHFLSQMGLFNTDT